MAAHFSTASQCQIPCCYTCGLVSAGATQGDCPKGKRGPLGITMLCNSVLRVVMHGTCEYFFANTLYLTNSSL